MTEPIYDTKGREVKPVKVADSLPFARACVAVMKERYGEDVSRFLKQRAFWVPVDVLPIARARVEHKKAG